MTMSGAVDNKFFSWDAGANRVGWVKKGGHYTSIASMYTAPILFYNFTSGTSGSFTDLLGASLINIAPSLGMGSAWRAY